MKTKTIFFGTVVLLLMSTAFAQQAVIDSPPGPEPQPPEPVKPVSPELNLTQLQERYNQRSDQIPSYVGSIIGDQTITVNLSEVNGTSEMLEEDVIGVKTDGVKTDELKWGEFEHPTLKIWITQENIERLSNAEKPPQELKEMMKDNDLRYETYTLGNSIKMSLMEFLLSF